MLLTLNLASIALEQTVTLTAVVFKYPYGTEQPSPLTNVTEAL